MIPAELAGPVIEPSDHSSTARLDTYVFFTPIAVGRGTAFMPCALFGVLYANAPDESYFLALPQCPFVAAPSTFGYPVSHGVQIRSSHQSNIVYNPIEMIKILLGMAVDENVPDMRDARNRKVPFKLCQRFCHTGTMSKRSEMMLCHHHIETHMSRQKLKMCSVNGFFAHNFII